MLSQPKALYRMDTVDEDGQIVSSWIPVPQNLWKFFSTIPQAKEISEEIKASVSTNVVISDGLGVALFIPVLYVTEDEKMWIADGTTVKPDGDTRRFSEWVGGLHDRRLTTEKGDELEARVIAEDLVELHWIP